MSERYTMFTKGVGQGFHGQGIFLLFYMVARCFSVSGVFSCVVWCLGAAVSLCCSAVCLLLSM